MRTGYQRRRVLAPALSPPDEIARRIEPCMQARRLHLLAQPLARTGVQVTERAPRPGPLRIRETRQGLYPAPQAFAVQAREQIEAALVGPLLGIERHIGFLDINIEHAGMITQC